MAAVSPAPASTASEPPPSSATGRQIPIVCPGHTRPLAELQFCTIREEPNGNHDDETNASAAASSSSDGTRTFLISACHDKMPMLRDASTGDWIGTFSGHKGAVWSCRLDPAALLAGTASGDFSVRVWDAITGESLHSFQHKHVVKTLDWSPDSRRLATGGHEGILRVFDITKPMEEPLTFVQSTKEKVSISKCNWIDNFTVLAAGEDGTIRFWKVDESDHSKQLSQTLSVGGDAGGIRDMEIQTLPSTGQTILTVAAGQNVTFFDLASGTLIHSYKMPIHFREEGGASLHPGGKKFIAGGGRR
eukprot:CAMPEP_0172553248 /NCGR_PEP_ID=MMETSP1067-20121228/49671_1 /TAXON_ID=265564 ORGANISM="Thalassiosira punctigera, Strain Tpunct2005C2" /NCGR_SAMPLE_ID=MMETSP1067 /ASSEMBLY_ACC=CAM_ASM_000444 /LENGTH=303 /DNA_ID=CAMNT_0013341403 /DNA_START=10 /DNA_END=918 /DNA_ORIENTATION=+